jgi:hypothetical protein
MSFLPFVLSFLLILVLGSSMLFTSFRSTAREKAMILAKKNAHLVLISEQAKKEFKKTQPRDDSGKSEKESKDDESAKFVEHRNDRSGMDDSKFNLWPLLHQRDPALADFLQDRAAKLIEILYKDADFYNPHLAQQIIGEIAGKDASNFLELFPEDEKLAAIFYKMVKGTNTGYPALDEYFKIESKVEDGKIQFRYASTPVLRAIFGEDLTYKILALERVNWEKNHHTKILTKEQLTQLIKSHGSKVFDVNHLDLIFTFNHKKDGIPHAQVDDKIKVMAKRGL